MDKPRSESDLNTDSDRETGSHTDSLSKTEPVLPPEHTVDDCAEEADQELEDLLDGSFNINLCNTL